MRDKIRRHLGDLLDSAPEDITVGRTMRAKVAGSDGGTKLIEIPPEFTPRQYSIFLLHVAAEIEHSLMVEYLYAGYSLGGTNVPPERRLEVAQWQQTILGIAKEEMGHLMTVQNLLRCLGGPLNLDREDYPWDSEFYPFPFELGPLTRESLASYVYAESPDPDTWNTREAAEIKELATKKTAGKPVHRVGALYKRIEELMKSPDLVADADFRGSTYPFQGNWDEWGRGYKSGARGNDIGKAMPGTPDLIVMPVTARTDALAALGAVATQGEANSSADDATPSHFARFLRIYRQFPKESDEWSPVRKVPVNPYVTISPKKSAKDNDNGQREGTEITEKVAVHYAHLFNIRYRLLLTNLLHSFEYPSNIAQDSQSTPRGLLVHATFGEMYNIRSLANILVQTPLTSGNSTDMAGPPFQVPYTLKLPVDLVDRWHLHLDSLSQSTKLINCILETREGKRHEQYLTMLKEVDRQTSASIEAILGGGHKHDIRTVR